MRQRLTEEEKRERLNAYSRKWLRKKRATMTPDEIRKSRGTERPGTRAERERRRRANMTPEQREEYNRKARERMARRYASMTYEEKLNKWDRGCEHRKARHKAAKEAKAQSLRIRKPRLQAENRRAFDADPAGICARIRRAIPRTYPSDVRDDVATDISIALFDGELALSEIESSVKEFIGRHYRAREWHTAVSMDAPVPGFDELKLGDTISTDSFRF